MRSSRLILPTVLVALSAACGKGGGAPPEAGAIAWPSAPEEFAAAAGPAALAPVGAAAPAAAAPSAAVEAPAPPAAPEPPPALRAVLAAAAADPAAVAVDGLAAVAADEAARGRLVLVWEEPGEEKTRALAQALAESKLFPELVRELNATFRLPHELTVRFADCGEANAFYDEEARAVLMCWELVQAEADAFKAEAKTEEEATAGLIHSTLFTFFHELGHALVHLLDLPITGKEEDAVDQLATWLLVDGGGEDGAAMAIDGALSFLHDAAAEEADGDEPDYAGEHALSEQRFYNIVCWVYGSKPDAFGELLASKDGPLPDERAEVCPDEWARLAGAWGKLLAPHLRP